MVRGRHIHHLVWGILILLLVGYGWLLDLGRIALAHSPSFSAGSCPSATASAQPSPSTSSHCGLTSIRNAYWSRAGRLSIDAVILFGSLLAVGAWGAPFFRGLHEHVDQARRSWAGNWPSRLFAACGCFVGV